MNPVAKKLLLAVYNPAVNYYRKNIVQVSHQRHFTKRTLERWALIEPELSDPPGSLLDIGCAEGVFTREAAAKGWCAWGIEGKPHAVTYAEREAEKQGLSAAFFASTELTPELAPVLPTFDVILLLSVYHQISKRFGETAARRLFADLLRACRRKLVFEPASLNRKYAEPVFARDNDAASIEAWTQSLVPEGWTPRLLGRTPYTEEECERFLYVIERKG